MRLSLQLFAGLLALGIGVARAEAFGADSFFNSEQGVHSNSDSVVLERVPETRRIDFCFVAPDGLALPSLGLWVRGEESQQGTTSTDGSLSLDVELTQPLTFEASGFRVAEVTAESLRAVPLNGELTVELAPIGRIVCFDFGARSPSANGPSARFLLPEEFWLDPTEPLTQDKAQLGISAEPLAVLRNVAWWTWGHQLYLELPAELSQLATLPKSRDGSTVPNLDATPVLLAFGGDARIDLAWLSAPPGVGEVARIDLASDRIETEVDVANVLPPTINRAFYTFMVRPEGRHRFWTLWQELGVRTGHRLTLSTPRNLLVDFEVKVRLGRDRGQLNEAETKARTLRIGDRAKVSMVPMTPFVALEVSGPGSEINRPVDVAGRRCTLDETRAASEMDIGFVEGFALVEESWVHAKGPIAIWGTVTDLGVWVLQSPKIVQVGDRRFALELPARPEHGARVVVQPDVDTYLCLFDFETTSTHTSESWSKRRPLIDHLMVPQLFPIDAMSSETVAAHPDVASARQDFIQADNKSLTLLGVPAGRYHLGWVADGRFVDWIAKDIEIPASRAPADRADRAAPKPGTGTHVVEDFG